jgi:hypothetical protein
MTSKRNIFNLSKENLAFLRIFQFSGFLPFKLTRSDRNYGKIASYIFTAFLVILVILKYFFTKTQPFLVILFGWEIIMLFLEQVLSWRSIHRQKKFLELLGEIDERFKKVLNKNEDLMKGNVRMQRAFVITFLVFMLGSFYYPISKVIRQGFSIRLFDSMSQILTWSILIHVNTAKFLYFYAIIAVRLENIKQCLIDMQRDKSWSGHFLIREISRDKFTKNITQHSKIMALKEIYERCWELQGHVYQLSGVFLITYFVAYLGQVVYLMFFYIKPSILEETFENQFFEILLWLALLNTATISYFVASQNMYMKGLKIAGLIHNIAQRSFNDPNIVQAVTLFSLQIQQQPITTISILGLFHYDRTNLNGVREKCLNT